MASLSRDLSKATKFYLAIAKFYLYAPVSKWMQLAVNWGEHILPIPCQAAHCLVRGVKQKPSYFWFKFPV